MNIHSYHGENHNILWKINVIGNIRECHIFVDNMNQWLISMEINMKALRHEQIIQMFLMRVTDVSEIKLNLINVANK
jgi:hypothetical protein